MKNQTKISEYNFEASEFNWEITPGKTIKAGDLTNNSRDLY